MYQNEMSALNLCTVGIAKCVSCFPRTFQYCQITWDCCCCVPYELLVSKSYQAVLVLVFQASFQHYNTNFLLVFIALPIKHTFYILDKSLNEILKKNVLLQIIFCLHQ